MRFLTPILLTLASGTEPEVLQTQDWFCRSTTGYDDDECVEGICTGTEISCAYEMVENLCERYKVVRATILTEKDAMIPNEQEYLEQLVRSETLLDFFQNFGAGAADPALTDPGEVARLMAGLSDGGIAALIEYYTLFPGREWNGKRLKTLPETPAPARWSNAWQQDMSLGEKYLVDHLRGCDDMAKYVLENYLAAPPPAMATLNAYRLASSVIRLTTEDQTMMVSLIRQVDLGSLTREELQWLFEVAVLDVQGLRSEQAHNQDNDDLYQQVNEMQTAEGFLGGQYRFTAVDQDEFMALVARFIASISPATQRLCPVGRVLQRIGFEVFGGPKDKNPLAFSVSQDTKAAIERVCPNGAAVLFEPRREYYLDALLAVLASTVEDQDGMPFFMTIMKLFEKLPLEEIELDRLESDPLEDESIVPPGLLALNKPDEVRWLVWNVAKFYGVTDRLGEDYAFFRNPRV